MNGRRMQPYIHGCRVEVAIGPAIEGFVVFFKRHIGLPVNRSQPVLELLGWHGDLVVMKLGKNREGFVNLVGRRDVALSTFVLER